MPAVLHHVPFGQFISQQDPTPNLRCVFDRLQAGGEGSPFFVPKIGVGRAGGQDQVVISDLSSAPKAHLARFYIDGHHFVHEHFGVLLVAQNAADGLRNVRRRQNRQRHLVEQRLENVMILPVDDGYIHGQVSQGLGRVQSAESSPHDHYAGAVCGSRFSGFSELAQICLALN